jgi:hypothetical protein
MHVVIQCSAEDQTDFKEPVIWQMSLDSVAYPDPNPDPLGLLDPDPDP